MNPTFPETNQDLAWSRSARLIGLVLVGLGVVLRIVRFVDGRSLWGDEAGLSYDIVTRSWTELMDPLTHAPSTPIGFLLVMKLATVVVSDCEFTLRGMPLVAGLLSLEVFRRLVRLALPVSGGLAVLAVLAVGEPFVHYSCEVRQYTTDILFASLLMLVTVMALRRTLRRAWLWLGLVGTIGVWFSSPLVFVCASSGLILIFRELLDRSLPFASRAKRAMPAVLVSATWAASFAIEFLLFFRGMYENDVFVKYWTEYFLPFPPTSGADWQQYGTTYLGYFNDPMGFPLYVLAAALALLGVVALIRRSPGLAAICLGPVVFACLASMAQRFPMATDVEFEIGDRIYPLMGRVLFFTTPAALICVGAGLHAIFRLPGGRFWMPLTLVLVLFHPTRQALANAVDPPKVQEMRSVLEKLKEQWRPGEPILVHGHADIVFRFYTRDWEPAKDAVVLGVRRSEFGLLVQAMRGMGEQDRIWLVHMTPVREADGELRALYRAVINKTARIDYEQEDVRAFVCRIAPRR